MDPNVYRRFICLLIWMLISYFKLIVLWASGSMLTDFLYRGSEINSISNSNSIKLVETKTKRNQQNVKFPLFIWFWCSFLQNADLYELPLRQYRQKPFMLWKRRKTGPKFWNISYTKTIFFILFNYSQLYSWYHPFQCFASQSAFT